VCCTLFSISGIIFLWGVATALKSDSIYFRIEGGEPTHEFAASVEGGMYIYVGTLVLSLLFWVRTYTAAGLGPQRPT
jgi:hypothetical protein